MFTNNSYENILYLDLPKYSKKTHYLFSYTIHVTIHTATSVTARNKLNLAQSSKVETTT